MKLGHYILIAVGLFFLYYLVTSSSRTPYYGYTGGGTWYDRLLATVGVGVGAAAKGGLFNSGTGGGTTIINTGGGYPSSTGSVWVTNPATGGEYLPSGSYPVRAGGLEYAGTGQPDIGFGGMQYKTDVIAPTDVWKDS